MYNNEWYFTDVAKVMAETNLLYSRLVERHPEKTKEALTAEKIVEVRKWQPTRSLYESRLIPAINKLGCFYIPKVMVPGPAFVFPLRSADSTYPRAQTNPLEGSVWCKQDVKYRVIGDYNKFVGPNWLGNDPETLKQIIDTQSVICVEGPFDLMAMRLMCPDYPSLSPLTKRLGKQHVAYLRILGVKRLLLMYDNEQVAEDSMEMQARQIKTMQVIPCECPSHDPSDALKKWEWAKELAVRTRSFFGY